MKIKIIKFENYVKPTRKHYNDAGADVYSTDKYWIRPHETVSIPLGFGLELPDGYAGFIFPRSGLSCKGITSSLAPVDSGYKGELHGIITNTSEYDYNIKKGDRIGQLVIMPIIIPELVESLGNERGDNGLGSSGR